MPGFPIPAAQPAAQPIEPVKRRRALPAVWMRAGTSKGLYLHKKDLPPKESDWAPVITRVMGSYDSDPKQLNGIGGATSTTSKVAVVSRSNRPEADVDYTFVQVALGSPKLDMTGNCGNIASGVGPFAVDEGMVKVEPGQKEVQVRVFVTNTNAVVKETVQVDDEGHFLEDGDCALPGLSSTGSRVQMSFAKPSGAMTGKLLPSGRPMDTILIQPALESAPIPVQVSLVDAANPFCFVDATSLPESYHEQGPYAEESIDFMELVRREAAVLMGLAKSTEEASRVRGTPKIAVLTQPTLPGAEIQVVAYSMGKVHGSLQLTGAVCLATAACTEGTVAHAIRNEASTERRDSGTPSLKSALHRERVAIRHTGGDMDVDVSLDMYNRAEEVTVFRTARRLFEGTVYYLQ